MPRRPALLGLAALLALPDLAGCRAAPPATPAAARATQRPGGVAGGAAGATLAEAVLTGTVKALADGGAGVLANNGAGLVSNHGSSLISDRGAGLTGKAKYGLAQGQARSEAAVATSVVEVLDPAGAPVHDDKGRPVTARTDAAGGFRIEARVPAGALLLRVALGDGAVVALVPASGGQKARAADVDTASTLGARYVLGRLVGDRPARVDALTPGSLATLRTAFAGALGELAAAPAYGADEMAEAAARLRALAAPVDAALKEVEALLLAGRGDLGDGAAATAVPLAGPRAVVPATDGGFWVLEQVGRVRRVRPDGTMALLNGELLVDASAMVAGPDGALYVAARLKDRVYRLAPDGAMTVAAGSGVRGQAGEGGPAAEAQLFAPTALAVEPDGRLLIAEAPGVESHPGRLLRVEADGTLRALAIPPDGATPVTGEARAMAIAPDGTLHLLQPAENRLSTRRPDGTWVHRTDRAWFNTSRAGLGVGPGGALYLAAEGRHQVVRLGDGTARDVVAGTGELGATGDGGPARDARLNAPMGLGFAADGTILVAAYGGGTVRAIAPDGTIRTVAGAAAASLTGDALEIVLNVPAAALPDPQGRLVIVESGGGTVRRLEGGELTRIAGGGGAPGDGPALDAFVKTPTFAAYAGADLLLAESENYRIRRLTPAGRLETALGSGTRLGPPDEGFEGKAASAPTIKTVGGLAGRPSGEWAFSDPEGNTVGTVRDGRTVRLAGTGAAGEGGEGRPGPEVPLAFPMGVAYAPDGALHVCDMANMRVLRLGPDGVATRVAGTSRAETLVAVADGDPAAAAGGAGGPALATPLLLPTGLAFAPDGTLYVATLGSQRVDALRAALGVGNDNEGSLGPLLPILQALPPVPARVWRIGADGLATIVLGPGGKALAAAEGPDALYAAVGLAVDAGGGLVVTDPVSGTVRRVPASALK